MVRKTSIKAFREIRNAGLLSKRRWQVYRALYRFGPATAGELNEEMNGKGACRKRLSELRDSGCVDEIETRPCKITGMNCIVWDVNNCLPTPYQKPPSKDQQIKELRKKIRKLKKIIRRLKS